MKNVVVNPEADPDSAEEIERIASTVDNIYPMQRDFCGQINSLLRNALREEYIITEKVTGCYKVDSYHGWLDNNGFTEEELNTIKKQFGNTNQSSLEKYVDNLDNETKKDYYYIPHVFLVYDNLIIDGASDMFNVPGMGKRNAKRYFNEDLEPIL